MKRVYLSQLLCPKRHCIFALAGEFESRDEAQRDLGQKLRDMYAAAIEEKLINPWCELCKSKTMHVDTAVTIFASMEQARRELALEEELQQRSAEQWKASRN
jgi:hypothetical protein